MIKAKATHPPKTIRTQTGTRNTQQSNHFFLSAIFDRISVDFHAHTAYQIAQDSLNTPQDSSRIRSAVRVDIFLKNSKCCSVVSQSIGTPGCISSQSL